MMLIMMMMTLILVVVAMMIVPPDHTADTSHSFKKRIKVRVLGCGLDVSIERTWGLCS